MTKILYIIILFLGIIVAILFAPQVAQTRAENVVIEEVELIVACETWQCRFDELPQVLQDVAQCESGVNLEAKNPYSTAEGLFQVLDGTYEWVWGKIYDEPVDWTKRIDPHVQMDIAEWLYEWRGLGSWQVPCGTLDL